MLSCDCRNIGKRKDKKGCFIMKKFLNKVVPTLIKFVPVCAALMLVINSNSTSTLMNGQPEVPKGLKKYRKF